MNNKKIKMFRVIKLKGTLERYTDRRDELSKQERKKEQKKIKFKIK
jgi:hypothetical protein